MKKQFDAFKQFEAVRLILTTERTNREICLITGLSKNTVLRYRRLSASRRVLWNDVAHLDVGQMHAFFNPTPPRSLSKRMPDLEYIHQRLANGKITLQLVWEDYCAEDPHTALCYSHVAALLQRYIERLPNVMRQHHKPGESADVDYSGKRAHFIDTQRRSKDKETLADRNPSFMDPKTRQRINVELFVGVLPASSLMFAMATPTQSTPDFIRAHTAMLEYFGGRPEVLVSDNLKAAVIKPGKNLVLNSTYSDFGRHHGIDIIPTRTYRPKDKASVEASVKVIQHRVLMRLNSMTFYSIDEINAAITSLLEQANERPMRKDGLSRRQRFNEIERDTLRPLLPAAYEYAEYVAVASVPQDYHVCVQGHFYSVPNRLIGKKVEARITESHVEILCGRQRVAFHARSHVKGTPTTLPEHQTEAHRAWGERSPEHLLGWAKEAGPHVLRFVQHQLNRGSNPSLGLPACDSLKGLAKIHGTALIDEVARKTLAQPSPTITAFKRFLSNQTQATRNTPTAAQRPVRQNSNLRGTASYAKEAASC